MSTKAIQAVCIKYNIIFSHYYQQYEKFIKISFKNKEISISDNNGLKDYYSWLDETMRNVEGVTAYCAHDNEINNFVEWMSSQGIPVKMPIRSDEIMDREHDYQIALKQTGNEWNYCQQTRKDLLKFFGKKLYDELIQAYQD